MKCINCGHWNEDPKYWEMPEKMQNALRSVHPKAMRIGHLCHILRIPYDVACFILVDSTRGMTVKRGWVRIREEWL